MHHYMTDSMQIDDGRVIIDTKMWSTYNPDQTVNLEAFDSPLFEAQSVGDDFLPFPSSHFEHNDHRLYEPGYRAIQALGHDVMNHMSRRSRRRQPTDMQANSMSILGLNPGQR